jgi:hypothetical protein
MDQGYVFQFLCDQSLKKIYTNDSATNKAETGNTKGGSITVLLTSCLTGLELAV